MSVETFLNGRVTLFCGDSRDVLKALPDNSIDSVVCDPPYALVSVIQRFGNSPRSEATENVENPYGRTGRGFMGQKWDTGETAFAAEFWAEVLRVLKPGGHIVAFSGTRTVHRLVCAIEDAGFEIRDQLQWLYGSGFPKSHDVAKGIDKMGAKSTMWFGPWLKEWRTTRGLSQKDLCERCGFHGEVNRGGTIANWEIGLGSPSPAQFNKICSELDLPFGNIEEARREVVGRRAVNPGVAFSSQGAAEIDITAPATDQARQWEGWGTALKPAVEPICLARKPLAKGMTVAGNVLAHGTGAINIDGCRISTDECLDGGGYGGANRHDGTENWRMRNGGAGDFVQPVGRWPANVLHDGSAEVMEAFPDAPGQQQDIAIDAPSARTGNVYGKMNRHGEKSADSRYTDKGSTNFAALPGMRRNDSGSAARFFYAAKADGEDRLGSKHPTVKPVDLMQWLCRLVTPKGGTVLDPFAGTGTTGEAAFREGFNAVLIEREAEYQADIRRRMALVMSGPEERKREAIKAKLGAVPFGDGSLFHGLEAS